MRARALHDNRLGWLVLIANRLLSDKTEPTRFPGMFGVKRGPHEHEPTCLQTSSDDQKSRHPLGDDMKKMPVLTWPNWPRRFAGLATIQALVSATIGFATPASAADDISQCRAIEDATARLKCYENLIPADPKLPQSSAPLTAPAVPQTIGRWRLVRTPNPRGGKEAISITRTGELSGSDPDFVGLMIRCAEIDIEVLLVLIRPLPFRAHPRVVINGTKFDSSVAPPGSAVLLPADVAVMARQSWTSLAKLSVEIEEAGTVTKGFVALDDFDAALKALIATCPLRN